VGRSAGENPKAVSAIRQGAVGLGRAARRSGGQTYRVALCLLHLNWKAGGKPVKFPNGMLGIDGVSRRSKWRALNDLERRGLITVERRPGRSPIVRLL